MTIQPESSPRRRATPIPLISWLQWTGFMGLRALVCLLSLTTLRVNHFYGHVAGCFLWWCETDVKRVSLANLKIAYPNLTAAERGTLLKKSLSELGKTMTELGHLWTGSERRIRGLIADVKGRHYVDEALAAGRGVITLVPHLGAWELSGLYLSLEYEITSLYRPPKLRAAERFTRRVRERFGAELVPTDMTGVRALRRALARNAMVGILPDQDPGESGGVYSPFYGRHVRTMLLASRLAAKTGCPVLFCCAERLPKGQGFRIHFVPADPLVASTDERIATTALNQGVQSLIEINPAQYQWSYKRFKNPPSQEASPYQPMARRAA
jgi:KDO2-lipid IV(A) lauroyltransferase